MAAPVTRHRDNAKAHLATLWRDRMAGWVVVALIDVAVIWFVSRLLPLGYFPLAAVVAAVAVGVNVILLSKRAYPLRWMVAGLVLLVMFTLYPIVFSVWVAFTNYGEGHLITKQQAIAQILKVSYLPETGRAYAWTAFQSPAGDYALWLIDADGQGSTPMGRVIWPFPDSRSRSRRQARPGSARSIRAGSPRRSKATHV